MSRSKQIGAGNDDLDDGHLPDLDADVEGPSALRTAFVCSPISRRAPAKPKPIVLSW
jgi:hypothetical protein